MEPDDEKPNFEGWVCMDCANARLGPAIVHTHTFHYGVCGLCHQQKAVMPSDDFAQS